MYQGASLWVDAWQCARTYGVQRPGKTSGAYNRSLCHLAAVRGGADAGQRAEAGRTWGRRYTGRDEGRAATRGICSRWPQ
jgi:hypothetical protein